MKTSISKLTKKVEQEENQWEQEKPLLERLAAVDKEKADFKKEKNKISTSKLLIIFLFLNCTIIELFTGWATVRMLSVAMASGSMIDFTPLVALIGAVVGEVFSYAIYAMKSAKENSSGGIIYDLAMSQFDDQPPSAEECNDGGMIFEETEE